MRQMPTGTLDETSSPYCAGGDDMKIPHTSALTIVQALARPKHCAGGDDYYPFGLTFNSYASGTKNNYLFNQGTRPTKQRDSLYWAGT